MSYVQLSANESALQMVNALGLESLKRFVEKPSVEEMGSLISVVSKGAVSGLNLLGLLPDKKTKHSKYPPTQVVNAFKLLFDRLKEALDPVEWSDMGLDTIVLEHSLCKLKRMKGPLGLLPNC